jgi:DNA-binding SARP family transcriptional activator
MRIHYRSGDRTAALRQYQRCSDALREELDVAPSARTHELYRRIRDDTVSPAYVVPDPESDQATSITSLPQALRHFRELRTMVVALHRELQQDIQAMEQLLDEPASSQGP